MKKLVLSLQSASLLGGTVFAWYTIYYDYLRFFNYGGEIFKFKECVMPNPLSTSCFYGGVMFAVAFIWSVWILFSKNILIRSERYLRNLLSFGVVFAWGNFAFEWYKYFTSNGDYIGCAGVPVPTPFQTPCFYGAMIYLISFIVSFYSLKIMSKLV